MLLRTSDLDTVPAEYQHQLVQQAMSLLGWWEAWKQQHKGSMSVNVEFRGEGGRAAGVHASELSRCLRLLTYAVMGLPRVVPEASKDVNMQRRMDVGTMAHALIQHEFMLMADWVNQSHGRRILSFEDEVGISPKLGGLAQHYNMHSSMDGLFTFWYQTQRPEDGTVIDVPYLRVGLEIKTSSGPEFEKLKEPKPDHVDQTHLYMAALDIPLMWTLYMNKSNSFFTPSAAPYLFKFNKEHWQTLERRIVSAYQYAHDKQLPARDEGRHCGWCPFAGECKPNILRRRSGVSSSKMSPKDF